jgi:hypothetical protein
MAMAQTGENCFRIIVVHITFLLPLLLLPLLLLLLLLCGGTGVLTQGFILVK